MNEYMKIADEEARKGVSKGHGGPFGAVIIKDGKVIARAHNMVVKKHDATCHAEVQAIRKASKKLKTRVLDGCILYSNCEPCPMCRAAINWAKIKKVYYGCNSEDAGKIGFDEANGNNTGLAMEQLDRDECWEFFKEYNGTKY